MRRPARSLFALVPLIGAAGLIGPAAPAAVAASAPAPASAASTGSELFVSQKYCVPDGDGSAEAPFCTISAAAAVVQPGQTVLVQPGNYLENVAFTRSGTEAAPITFRAANGPGGQVRVGRFNTTAVTGTIFTLRQVHDVFVEGFTVWGDRGAAAVVVDASSRVTVDGLSVKAVHAAGVLVTGGSQDVTVSRNWLKNLGNLGLVVEAGATGTTVVANQVPLGTMIFTDAPGSTITNNTVQAWCGPGIQVTGTSPGAVIANNIVQPDRFSQSLCAAKPIVTTAVVVAPGSVPGTAVHHNLIDPTTGWAPYAWAGTTYPTLGDFQAATGQGASDIAADPLLDLEAGGDRGYLPLKPGSPAIDSADATARGVPATDMLGNPHADDPTVANTGTGNGFHDRGAFERTGNSSWWSELHRAKGAGPLDTTLLLETSSQWTTDGPVGSFAYQYSDSPLWRLSGPSPDVSHRFRRAGSACAWVHVTWSGFRSGAGGYSRYCTTLGAHYTAVAPTRLLDTRSAIGVGTTTPVAANSEVVLPIDSIGGVPAADISAVVLNVTVTQPTASGFLTVYPDGTSLPSASNVNFVAKETVPNLVTVPMTNGKIRIRNSGSGTVHVVADLQGWYGAAGQGFATQTPKRVLDTRTGGGAFAPNSTRTLDLDRMVSPGATAVVLNVTVTAPQANGVLKVFPYGSPVPTASNLNFVTGQTIPNLVIVPVTDLKLSIHNQSSGSTHVIADLAGYFGSDGQLSYVPNGPLRIADTRDGTAFPNRRKAPLDPRETETVYPEHPYCCMPAAMVANLTVTKPTASGFLIAHPDDGARPAVSNVNFVAGETASNLAIVGTKGGLNLYNSSSGTTHVIVDQAGIFIIPQY
ncbi:Right handed beta helix region [Micromonospora viridifaciens]|uniref:Right handed beta helix region n=1 Tax=Micromonospora viridifaciens TaxID=1881 RepID=A0A1C5A165_MICVI|nr:right-handed parallel beta-helix repeat-containing protein [Micromonospora viridifaciens]SCF38925.1 Right handed beta helix region [Micromonospora viridifaciens]